MKQVEYKIKQSTYIDQNWFNSGDTIKLKEIHMVVNGDSTMRFTDKNGFYYGLEIKRFNKLFELNKISDIEK